MVHVFLTLTVCQLVGDVSCQSNPVLGVTGFMRWVPGRAGEGGASGKGRGHVSISWDWTGWVERGVTGRVWKGLPGSAP